jgi:hypothetical protein
LHILIARRFRPRRRGGRGKGVGRAGGAAPAVAGRGEREDGLAELGADGEDTSPAEREREGEGEGEGEMRGREGDELGANGEDASPAEREKERERQREMRERDGREGGRRTWRRRGRCEPCRERERERERERGRERESERRERESLARSEERVERVRRDGLSRSLALSFSLPSSHTPSLSLYSLFLSLSPFLSLSSSPSLLSPLSFSLSLSPLSLLSHILPAAAFHVPLHHRAVLGGGVERRVIAAERDGGDGELVAAEHARGRDGGGAARGEGVGDLAVMAPARLGHLLLQAVGDGIAVVGVAVVFDLELGSLLLDGLRWCSRDQGLWEKAVAH